MVEVVNLTVNSTANVIGIQNPIFSWQLTSSQRNVIQSEMTLQVAADSEFATVIWQHIAHTNQSVNFSYAGPALKSAQRYYVRVRVKTEAGEASAWSQAIYFETPLLTADEWQADWIAPAKQEQVVDGKSRQPFIATHQFAAAKPIRQARLYISALGLYEATINDRRVGNDWLRPGFTDYNLGVQYQSYDVSDYLKATNRIEVLVGEGWYAGQLNFDRDNYGETNALIAMLKIWYEDGSTATVGTDAGWQMRYSQIQSSSLYHGEWLDETKSETVSLPVVKRPLPLALLIPQEGPAVVEQRTITPIDLFTDPQGNLVLDIGENISGWIRFKNRTRAPRIEFYHGEVLDAEGNFYNANLRSAEAKDTYVFDLEHLDEGRAYEPHFTFHGFRYVKLVGVPKTVAKEDFEAVVITSANAETGTFETDNEMLNQLQANIQRSEDDNFVDIPTDCPQRDERMGWTADLQVFAKTAAFNRNVDRFLWKWLRDLRLEQAQHRGAVPSIVPEITPGVWIQGWAEAAAAWGDAATIVPWQLYQVFGDTQILAEQYTSMRDWVDFIRSQGDTEELWDTGFQYGDWVALDAAEGSYFGATDSYLCATAFFAYSTQIVYETAKTLGKMSDYREYKALHARIVAAYQKRFLPEGDRPITNTQTGNVLSLIFDLTAPEHRQAMADNLVALIEQNGWHMNTGFLGTPYLCHVLSRYHHEDVAYDLLFAEDFPSWLYQVKLGATTTWEHWDNIKPDGSFWSTDMNSFNHYAYGSIGQWLYEQIGGLINKAPGYQKTLIAPRLDRKRRVQAAKCLLATGYGEAGCQWRLEGERLQVEVVVAPNTTSFVVLPQPKDRAVLKQQILAETDGQARFTDGRAQHQKTTHLGSPEYEISSYGGREQDAVVDQADLGFELGSGRYQFAYQIAD